MKIFVTDIGTMSLCALRVNMLKHLNLLELQNIEICVI